MSFIEIEKLKFTYSSGSSDGGNEILDVSELRVEKGERIFLYGPSGSGKTTLLEILAGVLTAGSGRVSVAGKDLTSLSSAQRDEFRGECIGYIFQSFNLIPYLNVIENVMLPFQLARSGWGGNKIELRYRAEDLLLKLGLKDEMQSQVTRISIGQSQRVAAARALLLKPQLLLADEPTSSLDTDHRETFLKELFQLCEECQTSLVFVSHDRSIEKLFSRSINLLEINAIKKQSKIYPREK